MKCAETTAESVACLKTAVFNQTTQISDKGHHEADKTLGIEIFPLSEVVIFSLLVFQISELTIIDLSCMAAPYTIDCIDYVTGIGNAHAHNGVHSVLRLG